MARVFDATNPQHWLDAETDAMLRAYIVDLADRCIANKYEGAKCRLATFLAARIYDAAPVDLRTKAEGDTGRGSSSD